MPVKQAETSSWRRVVSVGLGVDVGGGLDLVMTEVLYVVERG